MSTNSRPIAQWNPSQYAQNALDKSWTRAGNDDPILPQEPADSIGHTNPLYSYTLPGPVKEGGETESQDLARNI